MAKSWLPFFRDTMYEPVFKDPYIFKVWMWILAKTSTRKRSIVTNNTLVELEPGEVLVESRSTAAEFLDISENKYRGIIDKLEKLGYIKKKTTNRYSVIIVMNWGNFVMSKDKVNQPITNQSPANNPPITNQSPAKNQPITGLNMNKNNINNKINNNLNNYNNSNNLNNCVPTPKSTKFRNFERSSDFAINKDWEKENLRKQLLKQKENAAG